MPLKTVVIKWRKYHLAPVVLELIEEKYILDVESVLSGRYGFMNTEKNSVVVSAAEFQRNIGKYQDIALTKPVAITKNGRERTVLLSADEYARLRRRDRRVLAAEELSERQIEAIRNAQVPEQAAAFDKELKDWAP
jgi:prevent-host-death family protein